MRGLSLYISNRRAPSIMTCSVVHDYYFKEKKKKKTPLFGFMLQYSQIECASWFVGSFCMFPLLALLWAAWQCVLLFCDLLLVQSGLWITMRFSVKLNKQTNLCDPCVEPDEWKICVRRNTQSSQRRQYPAPFNKKTRCEKIKRKPSKINRTDLFTHGRGHQRVERSRPKSLDHVDLLENGERIRVNLER